MRVKNVMQNQKTLVIERAKFSV